MWSSCFPSALYVDSYSLEAFPPLQRSPVIASSVSNPASMSSSNESLPSSMYTPPIKFWTSCSSSESDFSTSSHSEWDSFLPLGVEVLAASAELDYCVWAIFAHESDMLVIAIMIFCILTITDANVLSSWVPWTSTSFPPSTSLLPSWSSRAFFLSDILLAGTAHEYHSVLPVWKLMVHWVWPSRCYLIWLQVTDLWEVESCTLLRLLDWPHLLKGWVRANSWPAITSELHQLLYQHMHLFTHLTRANVKGYGVL